MQLPLPQPSTMMIVVGLNAAYQKRFVLPDESSLVPGQVHRAASLSTGVGGKGQNVFLALTQCLQQDNVTCAQFLGQGPEGDAVADLLQAGESSPLTVRTQAPLRTCTSIVSRDATTELIEPSGEISSEEWSQLLQRLDTTAGEGSSQQREVSHLAFMGSVPPGCPSTAYADIYDRVAHSRDGQDAIQLRCIIDSVVGLEELLPRLTPSTMAILKINRDELLRLANQKQSNSLLDAIQHLPAYYREKLIAIAITDGSQPAHIWYKQQLYHIPIPTLNDDASTPLYPIGAGDAVAAGCLAAWKDGDDDPVAAFQYGLACGSASCLMENNSMFSLDQVDSLLQQMGTASLLDGGFEQS